MSMSPSALVKLRFWLVHMPVSESDTFLYFSFRSLSVSYAASMRSSVFTTVHVSVRMSPRILWISYGFSPPSLSMSACAFSSSILTASVKMLSGSVEDSSASFA